MTYKPIPDLDGAQISEHGHVISRLGRNLKNVLSQQYYQVKVCGKTRSVHRLVAKTFLPNPENKPEVNHKDGNKLNNHYLNLEWCDHRFNMNHAIENLLMHWGVRTGTNVLDEIQVITIIQCLKVGIRNKDLATYFKVNNTTVGLIKLGINWKHISRI